MRVTLSTKALKGALTSLAKTTGYGSGDMRIEADRAGVLRLTTADGELTQVVDLPADVDAAGVLGLEPGRLAKVVTGNGATSLVSDNGQLHARVEGVTVALPTKPEPDWYQSRSVWPDQSTASVEIPLLAAIYVGAAASQDSYRPVLAAVRLDGKVALATDSYRLHSVRLKQAAPTSLSVPARAWALATTAAKRQKCDAITVEVDGAPPRGRATESRRVRLTAGHTVLQTAAVAGDYPKWQTLFLKTFRLCLEVSQGELADALGHTKRLDVEIIRLELDADKLVINAGDSNQGTTRLLVPVAVTPASTTPVTEPELLAVVNPKFLAATISGLDETVSLRFGEAGKAIDVKGGCDGLGVRTLLMPCRLGR
jgi:DNA polymerase III sliding clamp (beta) subunit (PCNA family)